MATDTDHGYMEFRSTAGVTRWKRTVVFITDLGTFDGQGGYLFPTTFAPSAHASAHKHGGSDEVSQASPGANAIPKAGSGGTLDAGWMPDAGAAQAGKVSTGTQTFSGAKSFPDGITVDTNTLHTDVTNNRVGIGTTSPSATFTVNSASADYATTVGNFLITESSNTNRQLRIGYDGPNEAGWIQASRIGVGFKPLGLNPNGGGVGVGTVAPTEALDVFGRLALRDMAAPAGGLTDGVRLWSESVAGSSELKVRDEAGNVTTLSPHALDAPAWLYDWDVDKQPPHVERTANCYTGTVTFENRTRAARLQEMMFGGKSAASLPDERRRLVHTETFAEYNARHGLKKGDVGFLEVESWDANQDALEVRREDERLVWRERKAEAGRQRAAAVEENKRRAKALAEWEKTPEDERGERPKELVEVPEPFEAPEPLPYRRKPAPAWIKKGKG